MSRTFALRRDQRRDRLIERVEFLVRKICDANTSEGAARHARMERSALMWALEEIERLDDIESILNSEMTDERAVSLIGVVVDRRHHPTEDDLDRNEGLAKWLERRREKQRERRAALESALTDDAVDPVEGTSNG